MLLRTVTVLSQKLFLIDIKIFLEINAYIRIRSKFFGEKNEIMKQNDRKKNSKILSQKL